MVNSAAFKLLIKYKIDDPVGSFPIFGLPGVWGCIAVGLFDKDVGLVATGSLGALETQCWGTLCIVIWTSAFSLTFFKILKSIGKLRVN